MNTTLSPEMERFHRFEAKVEETLDAHGLTKEDASRYSDDELLALPGIGHKTVRYLRYTHPYDPYGWFQESLSDLTDVFRRVMGRTGIRIYGADGNEPQCNPTGDVLVDSKDLLEILEYIHGEVLLRYEREDIRWVTEGPMYDL